MHAAPGSGGGDRLGQGAAALPLSFEEDQALTMAVALRAAAPAVRGMDAAAARVMARLDPLLPRRSGQRASAAHAAIASMPAAEAEPLVDAALLAQLAAACRDRVTLRLDYRCHSRAAITRSVEPTLRVNDGRRWYLLVWDCKRQDWRSLRADRIDRAAATGAQFAPGSARGAAAAVVQSHWRSTVPVPGAGPPGWYGGDTGSPHSALVGRLGGGRPRALLAGSWRTEHARAGGQPVAAGPAVRRDRAGPSAYRADPGAERVVRPTGAAAAVKAANKRSEQSSAGRKRRAGAGSMRLVFEEFEHRLRPPGAYAGVVLAVLTLADTWQASGKLGHCTI